MTDAFPPHLLTTNRRVRLLWPGDALVCPVDHKQKEHSIVIDHGGLRCRFKQQERTGAAFVECGMWLYLVNVPGASQGFRLIAEVTLKELRYMQTVRMDIDHARRFLGVDRWLRTGAA